MASRPPFINPQGKSGPREKVGGPDLSDGDARQWPGLPLYRPVSETHYLTTLATAWVKDQKLDQPYVSYYLEKLPDGYGLFETDRTSGEGQSYKRLFGHPSGKYYDSAKRFGVHFKWLMGRMEGDCECVLCSSKKPPAVRRSETFRLDSKTVSRPGSRTQSRELHVLQRERSNTRSKSATGLASEREKRQPKATEIALPVDEEGTEDIYKRQIQDLYKFNHKKVKDELVEKYSFDWKAERKSLPSHLSQVSLQHSFIPRVGELVLWCPYFPEELDLIFNPQTGFYQFYSFIQERFFGFPNWHGGVIAAIPASIALDGSPDFPDLLSNPKKKCAYNNSGFRVETFPDPNNDTDKSLSKQYKYVPLRQIRPLSHWQTLLWGIPEDKLDPSVKYALTGMTTVSLLEKFRFVGDWPNASIHCKGIYLGAELIILGDAVRILPSPPPPPPPPPPTPTQPGMSTPTPRPRQNGCTDVLVISSIRLNLYNITPEHTLPTSRRLSTHSSITLLGRAYTLDPRRDYRLPADLEVCSSHPHLTLPPPLSLENVKSAFPTVGAKHYGEWYPLHAPHQKYEISFDRVLGRLYEADALRLWTGMSQTPPDSMKNIPRKPSLNYDLGGVIAGRKYATQTDERIPEVPAGEVAWFWADTRVQALSVETFNGYEVGAYDLVRGKETLRAWRAMLKVLDGTASAQDVKDTRLPQRKGRQKGARLVDGRVVYPGDEEGEEKERRTKERSFSLGPKGNNQMSIAGLAQDSEDETSGDERGTGSGGGGGSAADSGLDTASGQEGEQWLHGHSARRNVRGGKRPAAPRSKMQIIASMEVNTPNDSDDGSDDDNASDDDSDDDDDDDEEANGSDDKELQDILEGKVPLARGGTEESEGGDYDPLLESYQSTAAARSSPGPREKRMKY